MSTATAGPMATTPKNYSVKEAAKELHISQSLMYELLKKRRVRHERHGFGRGTIIVPADALEEYRKSRTVQVVPVDPPQEKAND